MSPKRRLPIRLMRDHAMEATRVAVRAEKLVYVLVADKTLRYEKGKSRIVYIGVTRRGASRIARSIAARAKDVLSIRGVRKFHARIITCRPRTGVRVSGKLERALLLVFKEEYGEVPWCNTQGKRMRVRDEFTYFRPARIRSLLLELR